MPSRRAARRFAPRLVIAATAAGAAAVLLVSAAGAVLHRPAAQEPLEPFVGVTADGTVEDGLFEVHSTGVTTEPIRVAADRFVAGLTAAQRERVSFAIDDDEWRRWTNVHRGTRAGVGFGEMTERQRTEAIDLLRSSLSAKGLEQTRNIMRLNGHLADLLDDHESYGEHLYWLVVFGEPSATQPWGWQLEGHHLIINYFVLGDQVVMTPTFMGSEPVSAESGRYAGISVLQAEQAKGVAFMRSLDATQRARATLETSKPGNNALAQAYRDNLVLDYAGIPATALNDEQRAQLLDLIAEFVRNMRDAHARVRMDEVERHLDATHFAWIGGTGDDDVFYFRVHSPVILIEFDHQLPVALREGAPRVPTRAHVHSVVRTPNGNDYGRDLLRQHYERHSHDAAHGHRH
jgi:hypothetical protein